MKSEGEILADIRRLRHQLDRQRLTRTTAELKAVQAEVKALRAQLQMQPAPPPTHGSESTPTS